MKIFNTNSDFSTLLLQNDDLQELKTFKRGESIIEEGANSRKIFLQKTGVIKIVKNYEGTDPIIISFAFPNALIGLAAVLFEKKYEVTAIALEETSGWMISTNKFMKGLENKGIKRQVVKQMAQELLVLTERIGTMAQRSGLKRFLSVLIMLSEIYGTSDDGNLNLNLTIKELSEIVMLSRETMHHLIRDIENEGIISIKSKNITFLNYEKLIRMVQE